MYVCIRVPILLPRAHGVSSQTWTIREMSQRDRLCVIILCLALTCPIYRSSFSLFLLFLGLLPINCCCKVGYDRMQFNLRYTRAAPRAEWQRCAQRRAMPRLGFVFEGTGSGTFNFSHRPFFMQMYCIPFYTFCRRKSFSFTTKISVLLAHKRRYLLDSQWL